MGLLNSDTSGEIKSTQNDIDFKRPNSFSENQLRFLSGEKMRNSFLPVTNLSQNGLHQALSHRSVPALYESYIKDARGYLWLAEQKNGRIEIPVPWHYIWGDALDIFQEQGPDLKLVNLETSITTHEEPWPGKGINYRMHPGNVAVLTAAGINHCSLANNHILDWGQEGLIETIKTLESENIEFSGAGNNIKEAASPSVFYAGGHRGIHRIILSGSKCIRKS
jgi:poly-gamma-glutamate capsule biosynthesis protein CapA/YwtB (metallophosphatase superfamily)